MKSPQNVDFFSLRGAGAVLVRVRVRFAGAGAVLVRVKILRCGFVSAGAGKFFGAGKNISDLLLAYISRSLHSTENKVILLNFRSLVFLMAARCRHFH